MANKELAQRANFEIERHGSINAVSMATGVNPGVIWRVKNGGNSPTLRRLWKVTKHPPRSRLVIDCPPALRARFDAARGDSTRREYLEQLLDLDCGVAEMEI